MKAVILALFVANIVLLALSLVYRFQAMSDSASDKTSDSKRGFDTLSFSLSFCLVT